MNGIWITRLEAAGTGQRVAVKDLFDTAGIRTTYGSVVFGDHVPNSTADAVERLERAGYTTVGKANLHEFAFGITSQNPHYGTVPNPRFPGRTAGGSSGGSAAALVAGEAELGLGTDTGGSIRIPAACCEVVGFKPSFGLVAMTGCFPLAPTFDHGGPLAPDVAGCIRAMEVLGSVDVPILDSLAELRIGHCWLDRAEPEVAAVVDRVVTALGFDAVPIPLPTGVFPAFRAEIADVHRDLFSSNQGAYGENVRAKVAACLEVTAGQTAAARDQRERYRVDFEQAMTGCDLLVAPTLPIVPPLAERNELEVRERMTELTFPLNATGAPALALPCGRTDAGLPVSLQVIGRPGADGLVLAASAKIEGLLRHTLASPAEAL